jgi:hypothetical protein
LVELLDGIQATRQICAAGEGLLAPSVTRRLIAKFARLAEPVKTHIGHLLAKLHARDRAQLVIAAYESNLVRPRRR